MLRVCFPFVHCCTPSTNNLQELPNHQTLLVFLPSQATLREITLHPCLRLLVMRPCRLNLPLMRASHSCR